MLKEILVQVIGEETQVAVMEDHQLVEIYMERSSEQRLVGNIYKGRIENVLPGMQAAFVNIGLEKNAFLYVEDVAGSRKFKDGEEGRNLVSGNLNVHGPHQHQPIEELVREGQEILVQVVKEPIGTKGARVTTHITLPGRHLVLMPTMDYIGISRRIEQEEERERLRNLAETVKILGMGFIVRTVAEGVSEETLRHEVHVLEKQWKKILSRSQYAAPCSLIHRDLGLVQRILRDLFSEEVDRLIVNSRWVYDKILDALELDGEQTSLRQRLSYEPIDLFEYFGIEPEIEKALKRKVWLKSGGYLVIDQMEALTAIDVNTGKYVGSINLADTVLKTNLEAAAEIARQLRLRNIGGIIIIDFIDMESVSDQSRVLTVLEEELKKDKTRAKILGLTQLGLVEMTRKKVQQGLDSMLQRACPYCEGKGKVLSEETVSLRAQKRLLSLATRSDAPAFLLEAHPSVASILIGAGGNHLRQLEQQAGKQFIIKGRDNFHLEHVEIKSLYGQQEIEDLSMPVKVGQVLEVRVEEPHIINGYDGIARLNGYVLDIEGAGAAVGDIVCIEVMRVFRTYARARLLEGR
ncbi:MAG: Rne/Rng family ribonuclease [Syntrophomonadaceae bacterium]|nr:Rne/Rng family ribonuclease [Syntrophomonadaceae bacterium]